VSAGQGIDSIRAARSAEEEHNDGENRFRHPQLHNKKL
jgi:hypothetical protein